MLTDLLWIGSGIGYFRSQGRVSLHGVNTMATQSRRKWETKAVLVAMFVMAFLAFIQPIRIYRNTWWPETSK